jgi:hypothetical protein
MFNDRFSGAGRCFPVDYVLGIEYSKAVAPVPSVSEKMSTNWHETTQEALALAMKQKGCRTLASSRSANAFASKAALDRVLTAWSVGALAS